MGKLYTMEPKIEINLFTREVIVPEILRNIAVAEDNNAETVYIQVSDSFDEIPLNDKSIYVWFKNANNELYSSEITDIKHVEDHLIIAWKIDERLTRYAGNVQFNFQFMASQYKLNTLAGEFNILEGLDKIGSAPPLSNNLYEEIIRRLSNLENNLNIKDQIAILESQQAGIATSIEILKNEMKYLKENVVYIPT